MDVEGYINELVKYLHEKCPGLVPNIFPSYFSITSLQDVFDETSHQQQYQEWLSRSSSTMEYAMVSEIDYNNRSISIQKITPCPEIEHKLRSVEDTMLLLVNGSQEEIRIATQYFLEANKYEMTTLHDVERVRLLQEVYNVAYAIKIALRYHQHFLFVLNDENT